ncbi:MAG: hypothetical protein GY803_31255 [Chloroflexi bacterium]|nr:hypothetical protein [Chloroflexota bacterium]
MNSVTLSIEEHKIKDILKQAMLELMEERQELFQQLFAEVVEEVGLTNAVCEREQTQDVSREEIFQILEETV